MNGSGKIQQPTRYLPHLIVADVRERLVHVVYVIAFPSIGRTTSTTYRVSFGVAAGAAVHRSQIIVILCCCCWYWCFSTHFCADFSCTSSFAVANSIAINYLNGLYFVWHGKYSLIRYYRIYRLCVCVCVWELSLSYSPPLLLFSFSLLLWSL